MFFVRNETSTTLTKSAIVIGAGIGGLASAVRLKAKGFSVKVFDKNEFTGGKLHTFRKGEYRFDFGPSLFTMPQYVDELFHLVNKNPRDYFSYISCNEACKYFFSDDTSFTAKTDEEAFIQEACNTFNIDKTTLEKYFHTNAKIFENAGKVFLENSLHRLKTWMSPRVIRSLTHSYVLDMMKSMHTVNEKQLQDPRLIQLFDRYATYNGSSPFRASAILNSISSLEHRYGTYFPVGGMYAIPQAVTKLAEEEGVEFYLGQEVEEILQEGNRAIGVKVNGEIYYSDVVVSNMDVQFTFERLLDMDKKSVSNREKSSSAVIFYWGVGKKFDQLGLHNIFFSEDYKKEFQQIFGDKVIPEDPTIYVNISSKHHEGDAPIHGENWFTMINVPADFGQDWDKMIGELRNQVISKLSAKLGVDLGNLIEEEYIADPRVIESKTLSHNGALYGSSSNHWLSAFLRQPNFSRKIKGLYFVGGSVHPGGGIPLCLLSAKIATEII